MNRRDLVLAILAASNGRPYTPAKLQKTAFLISENLPEAISEGPGFNFVPYDYGPFDAAVYFEAQALEREGLASNSPSGSGRWVTYAATPAGIEAGRGILRGQLSREARQYIEEVSAWALRQTFSSLVKSIYKSYPRMRENSIFRD